jgi:hypothetical protein
MLEDLKHGTRYDGFLLLIKRVFVIRLPVVPGKSFSTAIPASGATGIVNRKNSSRVKCKPRAPARRSRFCSRRFVDGS